MTVTVERTAERTPKLDPLTVERLLWFVDRHAENVVRGDLAPVLADCGGAGRSDVVHELKNLPLPINSALVEKVRLSSQGFIVQIRYACRGRALVMTTIWEADVKGRLQIVRSSCHTQIHEAAPVAGG